MPLVGRSLIFLAPAVLLRKGANGTFLGSWWCIEDCVGDIKDTACHHGTKKGEGHHVDILYIPFLVLENRISVVEKQWIEGNQTVVCLYDFQSMYNHLYNRMLDQQRKTIWTECSLYKLRLLNLIRLSNVVKILKIDIPLYL